MKSPALPAPRPGEQNRLHYSPEHLRTAALHFLLGRGISGAAGFACLVLLVRHMKTADYAGYTALLALVSLAALFSDMGMERAITRFVPEGALHYPRRILARFIWTCVLLRLSTIVIVTAVLASLWQYTGAHLGSGVAEAVLPVLAVVLIANVMFSVLSAVLQALLEQKFLTRVLSVQWLARLSFIVILVVIGADVTLGQALWLMAVPDTIAVVLQLLVIHRRLRELQHSPKEAAAAARWPSWPNVTRLAADNFGYHLLTILPQGSSMVMVVAAFLSAPFVAAYGFYVTLINRARQYLPLPFMLGLMEPVLITRYLADYDFQKLCERAQLLYRINLMVLLALLAWVACVGSQLTAVLTNGRYTGYTWLWILLLSQLAIGSHAVIMQIVINTVGQSRIFIVAGVSALVAMAATMAAIIATGHLEYLVAAPLVYEVVNNVVSVAALRKRRFMYDPQWRLHLMLLATTAIALVCARSASHLCSSTFGQVLVAGAVSVTIFMICALPLRLIRRDELLFLARALKRAA